MDPPDGGDDVTTGIIDPLIRDLIPPGPACQEPIDLLPATRQGGSIAHYTERGPAHAEGHDGKTHAGLARRIGRLLGLNYVENGGSLQDPPLSYLVPSDTLVGLSRANAMGIRSEADLFGAVVPHAFMATKAITHPVVALDAVAPEGWTDDFAETVAGSVLFGFTAFSIEDARSAGRLLFASGPVRLKSVLGVGGRGQMSVANAAELDEALDEMDPGALATAGLVLEEDLKDVVTLSVGQVRLGGMIASYHGTQRLTHDHPGEQVYGGSDLHVVRGGFDVLLALDLPERVRLAVAQARCYDNAADQVFPDFFASRRNYDVAQGLNGRGIWRSGVLEQSWRIGGASGAEVAALEAFHADPGLTSVHASTHEVYGDVEPPADAILSYSGEDAEVGRIVKFTTVERA